MSAYENFRLSVEYAEEKGFTEIKRSVKASRHLLDEVDNRLKAIEKLQAMLKNVPLEEGDVVHEAGYPEERGDVIEVRETEHETIYRVTSRHRKRTLVYYRDELEFVERPGL
jgi:hypothetical protein